MRRATAHSWSLPTPELYHSLYENKLLFHYFFGAVGLPLPRVYGVYEPYVGFTSQGTALRTVEDLGVWLEQFGNTGFVFKPLEGDRANRALVIVGRAPGTSSAVLTLAGDRYDAEALVRFTAAAADLAQHDTGANPTAFLIEERLLSHPTLAEVFGPTLCTVRVQTVANSSGRPQITAAVIKLQPGTVGLDRLRHSTAVSGVDLESGRLGSYAGMLVPDWADLKDLVVRAAAAFPWARSIGWDIGVSSCGPVLMKGSLREAQIMETFEAENPLQGRI